MATSLALSPGPHTLECEACARVAQLGLAELRTEMRTEVRAALAQQRATAEYLLDLRLAEQRSVNETAAMKIGMVVMSVVLWVFLLATLGAGHR